MLTIAMWRTNPRAWRVAWSSAWLCVALKYSLDTTRVIRPLPKEDR